MRTTAIALLLLAGCIDEFHGSNVQIDMSTPTPVQASVGVTPTAAQLPDNIHFTLYAFEQDDSGGMDVGRLFEIDTFEIHRLVDLSSPCFIDVGPHVPFPGLHVSHFAEKVMEANGFTDVSMPPAGATEQQKIDVATAITRQRNVDAQASDSGLAAITSTSGGGYATGFGTDCNDMSGFPPASCTDDASNARRLTMCQAAWDSDPNYFEGTDRVLTVPLNGTTRGFVDGMNPVNFAPVGGAQFFVDESLTNFAGYAVYWQYDDTNHDGKPDYPASVPIGERNEIGVQLLFGKPTAPTRGVIHVHMANQTNPAVTAEVAIFADIDQDDVHF